MRAQRVGIRRGLAGLCVRGAQVARTSREVDLVLELEGRLALVLARGAEGVAGGGAAAQALDAPRGGGDVCERGVGGGGALRSRLGSLFAGGDARGRVRWRVAHSCRSRRRRFPSGRNPRAARGASSTPRRPRRSARRRAARRTTRAVRREGACARACSRARARPLARHRSPRNASSRRARSPRAVARRRRPWRGAAVGSTGAGVGRGHQGVTKRGRVRLTLNATSGPIFSGPRFCAHQIFMVYDSWNLPDRFDTSAHGETRRSRRHTWTICCCRVTCALFPPKAPDRWNSLSRAPSRGSRTVSRAIRPARTSEWSVDSSLVPGNSVRARSARTLRARARAGKRPFPFSSNRRRRPPNRRLVATTRRPSAADRARRPPSRPARPG